MRGSWERESEKEENGERERGRGRKRTERESRSYSSCVYFAWLVPCKDLPHGTWRNFRHFRSLGDRFLKHVLIAIWELYPHGCDAGSREESLVLWLAVKRHSRGKGFVCLYTNERMTMIVGNVVLLTFLSPLPLFLLSTSLLSSNV